MIPKKLKILVVEDDQYLARSLAGKFSEFGVAKTATDRETALRALGQDVFDVVSIDLHLSDDEDGALAGLEILRRAKASGAFAIVVSGRHDRKTIDAAISDSVDLFIKKIQLDSHFSEYIAPRLRSLQTESLDDFFETKFITRDANLRARIQEVLQSSGSLHQRVMLTGPTGSGKTLIARLIHEHGAGSAETFVHVNISGIPTDLFEAAFFGSEKGAYTGADRNRAGYFERADGGTLFIDEIGTIPLAFQQKLLTTLDLKVDGNESYYEYQPLGARGTKRSRFRLVTGTCNDLAKLWNDGKLREDFFYRIASSNPVEIPGLSQRRADIELLIERLLEKSPRAISLSDDALTSLLEYDWPGNVRELEELMRELIEGRKNKINRYDLPLHVIQNNHPLAASAESRLYTAAVRRFIAKQGLRAYVRAIETAAFKDMMSEMDGKITKAADALQISKGKAYDLQKAVEGAPD